jgi:hypothetical protein
MILDIQVLKPGSGTPLKGNDTDSVYAEGEW